MGGRPATPALTHQSHPGFLDIKISSSEDSPVETNIRQMDRHAEVCPATLGYSRTNCLNAVEALS
eukprot:3098836-Pleurochrysis_carterae.AAC.1